MEKQTLNAHELRREPLCAKAVVECTHNVDSLVDLRPAPFPVMCVPAPIELYRSPLLATIFRIFRCVGLDHWLFEACSAWSTTVHERLTILSDLMRETKRAVLFTSPYLEASQQPLAVNPSKWMPVMYGELSKVCDALRPYDVQKFITDVVVDIERWLGSPSLNDVLQPLYDAAYYIAKSVFPWARVHMYIAGAPETTWYRIPLVCKTDSFSHEAGYHVDATILTRVQREFSARGLTIPFVSSVYRDGVFDDGTWSPAPFKAVGQALKALKPQAVGMWPHPLDPRGHGPRLFRAMCRGWR